jgi:hypothetical protein
MTETTEFLAEIKKGAQILGISPKTLCAYAVKNGRLIRRLEAGGQVTLQTVEDIRAYIEAHRPKADDGAKDAPALEDLP